MPSPESARIVEQEHQRLAQLGEGLFGETEWPHVEKALEQEYARVLPIAKAGLKGLLGGSTGDSEHDLDGNSRSCSAAGSLPGPETSTRLIAIYITAGSNCRSDRAFPLDAHYISLTLQELHSEVTMIPPR